MLVCEKLIQFNNYKFYQLNICDCLTVLIEQVVWSGGPEGTQQSFYSQDAGTALYSCHSEYLGKVEGIWWPSQPWDAPQAKANFWVPKLSGEIALATTFSFHR